MALRLLGANETKTIELGRTKFTVRKVPHGVSTALMRKHTHKGRLDEVAFGRDLWVRCLVGWENLCDAAGATLTFSADPVPYTDPLTGEQRMEPLPFVVALSLPDSMASLLATEAREAEIKVEEASKN